MTVPTTVTAARPDAHAPLLVIGAGPAGLGAAHRLAELGEHGFRVLEASGRVGGLAGSETDRSGFTYDFGGHVLFSAVPYYREAVERALGQDYVTLERDAWILTHGRYVRYPFQANLRDLGPRDRYACLRDLVAARCRRDGAPASFADWARARFGAGIARRFMLPYNAKVWAWPLEDMTYEWVGERVAAVDVPAVLRNVVLGRPDGGWGPNRTFRYPRHGGTGRLWSRLAEPVSGHIVFGARVVAVDPARREVRTSDGRRWAYSRLLSTMPLDELVAACPGAPARVRAAAASLVATGTHVVGVGVDAPAPTPRTWIYYPDADVPFHRVTCLSNYSPHVTARPGQSLLVAETAASAYRPVEPDRLVGDVLAGLRRVGLLDSRAAVASVWHAAAEKTYPVPTLGRDDALATIEPWLAEQGVESRGRLGAWRYETGNMDHAFMQGVAWADRVRPALAAAVEEVRR